MEGTGHLEDQRCGFDSRLDQLGDAGSSPVVAEHFFGSYQNQFNRKTVQDQLYNFARFYHSRTSDKGSKKFNF